MNDDCKSIKSNSIFAFILLSILFFGHNAYAMGQETCSGDPGCDKSALFSQAPTEGFCVPTTSPHSISMWKNYADTILIGKVLEVRTHVLPGWVNECWAKLEVSKYIKNSLGNEVWLMIAYSPYKYPYTGKKQNYSDQKNCPVEQGNEYLIFSYAHPDFRQLDANLPLIISAYDERPGVSCTPIVKISDAENLIKELETMQSGE